MQNAAHLFLGKTIKKMNVQACNNIEFLFTDGTKVALHIDVDYLHLPVVAAFTSCVDITDD